MPRLQKEIFERQGTPLFDSRLPQQQVVSVVEHLVEGNGLHKTGRPTGADYRTVGRYARIAGEHAEQLHDELVNVSPQDGGNPVRREVGLREKETKKLRRKQSG